MATSSYSSSSVEDLTVQDIASALQSGTAVDVKELRENGFYVIERLLEYNESDNTIKCKWKGYDKPTWEPLYILRESVPERDIDMCIKQSEQKKDPVWKPR